MNSENLVHYITNKILKLACSTLTKTYKASDPSADKQCKQ